MWRRTAEKPNVSRIWGSRRRQNYICTPIYLQWDYKIRGKWYLYSDGRTSRPNKENVKEFGWDFEALEEEGKLAILDACSTKIGIPSHEKYVDVRPFDMRSMMDQIIGIQDDIKAKRAVVDGTTSIGFYLQDPSKIRVELLKLSTTLEILGLTSLMTCEIIDENNPSRFGVEMFVTEGTILMYYKRTDSVRTRSIEIFKMRGSDHSKNIHPYEITLNGIVVHPHEEVYTA